MTCTNSILDVCDDHRMRLYWTTG